MIAVIDLKAALGELKTLRGRTPETAEAEREGAFAKLSQYRDGGIFAAKFSGESAWERHPNGDEIVQIVEGKTTVHLMTDDGPQDRKSTRLNSSHLVISYAVFCLKKKKIIRTSLKLMQYYVLY